MNEFEVYVAAVLMASCGLARVVTAKSSSRLQRQSFVRRYESGGCRRHIACADAASTSAPQSFVEAEYAAAWPGVKENSWKWNGYNIRYVHIAALAHTCSF